MPQAYDFLGGVQSGQDWVKGLYQDRAQVQAGRALQGGNFGAASGALLGAGDLQGGLALRQRGQQEQVAQQAQVTADQARLADFTLKAARALKSVPPEQRGQAYSDLAPTLQMLGQSPQEIAAFGQAMQQNPAVIDQAEQWAGQTVAAWEFKQGPTGDIIGVRQGQNGAPETTVAYDAPDRPISTPYGIILPPQANAPQSGGQPQAQATGTAISANPLWQRQVQQESGGQQFGRNGEVLTSPAGAFGVAQLMPGTAADMARQMGVTVEQLRSDPALNEAAGQRYQNQQLEKYGGNQALALAAYNAGPGRVDEWIQRFGDPRTGEISTEEFVASIPFAETRQYVQNITNGDYGQGDNEGDAGQQTSGLQQLGGGYTLQQMQTPADQRAERQYQLSVNADRRAETAAERAARSEERTNSRLDETVARQDRVGTSQLRREFNGRKEVAEFREVDNAYRSMQTAVRNPSPAGDINLIFSYMKVLDPTSTVREGEFATASNAGSAFEAIGNQYNRVLQGTRLNARQRQDFLNQAGSLRASREQRFGQIRSEYEQEARINGYDPQAIVGGVNDQGQRQRPRTNAPGLPFNITDSQLAIRRNLVARGATPSARPGDPLNPIYINPQDEASSIRNLRPGQWFVPPRGTTALQVPPRRR